MDEAPKATASGIVIPDVARAKEGRPGGPAVKGRILAVGPGTTKDHDGRETGKRVPMQTRVGDAVLYKTARAMDVTGPDGEPAQMVREIDVVAILEQPVVDLENHYAAGVPAIHLRKPRITGYLLRPDDIVEASDYYESTSGNWELCPCAGVRLAGHVTQVGARWVRPL